MCCRWEKKFHNSNDWKLALALLLHNPRAYCLLEERLAIERAYDRRPCHSAGVHITEQYDRPTHFLHRVTTVCAFFRIQQYNATGSQSIATASRAERRGMRVCELNSCSYHSKVSSTREDNTIKSVRVGGSCGPRTKQAAATSLEHLSTYKQANNDWVVENLLTNVRIRFWY
uniref:Uncharacterized protein n=1 Tax=Ceratitis capitata TaxID=7213 RepID=W8API6_CERCA